LKKISNNTLFVCQGEMNFDLENEVSRFCEKSIRILRCKEHQFKNYESIDDGFDWVIVDFPSITAQGFLSLKKCIDQWAEKGIKTKLLIFINNDLYVDYLNIASEIYYQLIDINTIRNWNEIVGLILCGGRSTRMGEVDKSLLCYHDGLPQYLYLANMLRPYLGQVYLSVNDKNQHFFSSQYPLIVDHFVDIGPISGLASAFQELSKTNMMVIGCDYPFIEESDFIELCKKHHADFDVTCMKSSQSIEPIIGIYSSRCCEKIKDMISKKRYSLKYFILENTHQVIDPQDLNSLRSIDTLDDYIKVKTLLK
jgi:molybdenum cofactor guanylyltransferase